VITPPFIATLATRLDPELLVRQHARWRDDPQSVEPTWAAFFEGFELGRAGCDQVGVAGDAGLSGRAYRLVAEFRRLGHTQARLNPLASATEANPQLAAAFSSFGPEHWNLPAAAPDFQRSRPMPRLELIAGLEEI